MDNDDPLNIAKAAILQVANIASSIGVKYRNGLCGRLGGTLLLVEDYLEKESLEHEERLRQRVIKLLRDVEKICSWPQKPSGHGYPLLEAVAWSNSASPQYKKALASIQRGLLTITSRDIQHAKVTISHLEGFMKSGNAKHHEGSENIPTKRSALPGYPNEINLLVSNVLQEYMSCTCNDGIAQNIVGKHLTQLMLRPPVPNSPENSQVRLDMLFSSLPVRNGSQLSRWQDVEIIVPKAPGKPKKSARFSAPGPMAPPPVSPETLVQVDRGQFCKLIGLDAGSRVCLMIKDGKLQKSGFKPMERIVEPTPGISLAHILNTYKLTSRMKVTLAYILAHSVWKYYNSDWMKTRWTSESIQFMTERERDEGGVQGKLFAWKPYLSVRFGDEEPGTSEYSAMDGEIHHFPRIRALGILLVEIGIGSPFQVTAWQPHTQPLAAIINKDWRRAMELSRDDKKWGDFEYPDYRRAVEHCLDPGVFPPAPYHQAGSPEYLEGLKQRRDILHEKVVSPLEELLEGTKWMQHLTKIGPLENLIKSDNAQAGSEQAPVSTVATGSSSTPSKAKKVLSQSQKDARRWLRNMRRLNSELAARDSSSAPIRIAVLDTGCDDNAPFFFDQSNTHRFKGWKDFVEDSEERQDCHGHGTHLVSLIMRIAPDAHFYVARIAKSHDELAESSENVAKAISWASNECKADIISMSFGFADEQPLISKAILEALYRRNGSILFFAAASNYGANEKEMFPARHESVISIRATNSKGNFEDFNPPRSQNEVCVFGTLGVDVPAVSFRDSDGEEEYKSGTSVANAVAVGIAGTLLGYVSRSLGDDTFKEANEKLRKRQGMQAMLRALAATTQQESYLYLTPWKLMGKADQVRRAIIVAALSDV